MPPDSASSPLPPRIPDHELVRMIGRGAYGEVWLARNLIGVYRAIKVVRRSTFDSERPFEREFKGIQNFEPISRSHPAFVAVLHVGENRDEGYFYYVMELGDDPVTGQQIIPERYVAKTLAGDMTTGHRLPLDECIRIGLGISDALAALHRGGLVHRDIKPSNIIFVNGQPKLADIGLVQSIGDAATFVGTQGYIPPEGPGTVQADVFALGKLLYEISTGNDRQQFPELPTFVADSNEGRLFSEFNEVLVRACESNPASRYSTAEELNEDLQVINEGQSVRRLRLLERRWRLAIRVTVVAALVLLIGGSLGAVLWQQHRKTSLARAQQTQTTLAYASRIMGEGKLLQALPWFIDAADTDDEVDEKTHRTRIGALLQFGPRLAECWWDTNELISATCNHDSSLIAYSDKHGLLKLLRRSDGTNLAVVHLGEDRISKTLRFSPDGKLLAVIVAGEPGVLILSVPDLGNVGELTGNDAAMSLAFSPDGESLFVGYSNSDLAEWNLNARQVRRRFVGHQESIQDVSCSPDGSRIVSGSNDGQAIVWNRTNASPLLKLSHSSWVLDAQFSPDGRWIATGCFDNAARVWNATNGELRLHPLKHSAAASTARFSPDGRYLAVATFGRSIQVWNLEDGTTAAELPHGGTAEEVTFSSNGRYVLFASTDRMLRLWDYVPATLVPDFRAWSYSADGRRAFNIATDRVEVTSTADGSRIGELRTPYSIAKVVADRQGQRLIAVPAGGLGIQRWAGFDFSGGKELALEVGTNRVQVSTLRIGEEGNWAFAVRDKTVEGWNLVTGRREWERSFTNSPTPIPAPTGNRLLVIADNEAMLLEASTGIKVGEPLQHSMAVRTAAFSPDGALVVTTTSDGSLYPGYAQIWEVASGKARGGPMLHSDGVVCAAFSPDGKLVATGGEDFIARVWDLQGNPRCLPLQHDYQVSSVQFSSNGRWLATGGRDNTARLWEVTSSSPVIPPLRQTYGIGPVLLSGDDGKLLVNFSSAVLVYPLLVASQPLEDLKQAAEFLSGIAPTNRAGMEHATNVLHDIYAARPSSDLDWHVGQGIACELKFNLAGAELHLQAAHRLDPERHTVLLALSRVYALMGKWSQALEVAQQVRPFGRPTETLNRQGLLQIALKRTNDYVATARKLVQLAQSNGMAVTDDAWTVALAGGLLSPEEARAVQRAVQHHGGTAENDVIRWLLSSYVEAGDPLTSEFRRRSLRITEGKWVEAVLLARANRVSEARQMMEEARAMTRPKEYSDRRTRLFLLERLAEESVQQAVANLSSAKAPRSDG